MDKHTLLVISHAPSANTKALRDALVRGALEQVEGSLMVKCLSPFETSAKDVLNARGIIIGSTENFGYMAGTTKDFFDRCYYDLLDKTDALPYAVYIRAGLDGTGSEKAITNLCSGLKWRQVQAPIILKGKYQNRFEQDCASMGAAMAAGLSMGVF